MSILRFLTMFFRGKKTKNDLKSFREALWMSAVDGSDAASIRNESDLDKFIAELESQTSK